MKAKKIILIVILLVAGIVIALTMLPKLAGHKPTVTFKPEPVSSEKDFDEFLNPAREAVKNNPKSLEALKEYASRLEKILSIKFLPFFADELTSVYENILTLDSKVADSDFVIRLADTYFNIRKFDQAEKHYRNLINTGMQNQEVRGRLASSLSFQGKYKEAITELNLILKDNPNSFQGLAYLAITHAQMGEKQEAIKYGKQALQFAPSAEAKLRFKSFLQKLDPKDKDLNNKDLIEKVTAYMKDHSILQNKFIRAMIVKSDLNIYLKEFPIDQMPEIAREKFFSNLKKLVEGEKDIAKIVLKDQENDKILKELVVN